MLPNKKKVITKSPERKLFLILPFLFNRRAKIRKSLKKEERIRYKIKPCFRVEKKSKYLNERIQNLMMGKHHTFFDLK